MPEANLDLVREMYAAWFRMGRTMFDDPGELGLLDPDIELHPDPEADWVGINDRYRGRAGVARYMAAVYEAFEDYRPEVEELIEVGGDKVLTLAIEHGRGRGSGAEVQANKTAHVWTIRDGLAVRLDLYLERSRALETLGLPAE